MVEATGERRTLVQQLTPVILVLEDFRMRDLAANAAETRLEILVGRHEAASTLITTNRPVSFPRQVGSAKGHCSAAVGLDKYRGTAWHGKHRGSPDEVSVLDGDADAGSTGHEGHQGLRPGSPLFQEIADLLVAAVLKDLREHPELDSRPSVPQRIGREGVDSPPLPED